MRRGVRCGRRTSAGAGGGLGNPNPYRNPNPNPNPNPSPDPPLEQADETAAAAAVRVDTWAGDEEGLYALREQGAGALLLRDACEGSVYYGTERCAALIRLSQSEQSPGVGYGLALGLPLTLP